MSKKRRRAVTRRKRSRKFQKLRERELKLELLEDRRLLALTLPPHWVEQGPGPIIQTPESGRASVEVVGVGSNPVAGAIDALAAHPADADILVAGSVSGGVWVTRNAQDIYPHWEPLTDGPSVPSLSISDLAFSTLNNNIVYATTGSFSSAQDPRLADDLAQGILRIDITAGVTNPVTPIQTSFFTGLPITSILPVMSGPNTEDLFVSTLTRLGALGKPVVSPSGNDMGGVFRVSTTAAGIASAPVHEYSQAPVTDLAKGTGSIIYAGVPELGVVKRNGTVYSTINGIGTAALSDVQTSTRIDLAAHSDEVVYAAVIEVPTTKLDADYAGGKKLKVEDVRGFRGDESRGAVTINVGDAIQIAGMPSTNPPRITKIDGRVLTLSAGIPGSFSVGDVVTAVSKPQRVVGLYRTDGRGNATPGDRWASLNTAEDPLGIVSDSSSDVHFSLAADPNLDSVVYIGGGGNHRDEDCQVGTGIINRVSVRGQTNNQFGEWQSMVCSAMGQTAPHADSRAIVFDVNGDMIQADDGGIYRLPITGVPITKSIVSNEIFEVGFDVRPFLDRPIFTSPPLVQVHGAANSTNDEIYEVKSVSYDSVRRASSIEVKDNFQSAAKPDGTLQLRPNDGPRISEVRQVGNSHQLISPGNLSQVLLQGDQLLIRNSSIGSNNQPVRVTSQVEYDPARDETIIPVRGEIQPLQPTVQQSGEIRFSTHTNDSVPIVHNITKIDSHNYVEVNGDVSHQLAQTITISGTTINDGTYDILKVEVLSNVTRITTTNDGNLFSEAPTGQITITPIDYRPQLWQSLVGDLRVAEVHAVDFDAANNILIAGTQDNGSIEQFGAERDEFGSPVGVIDEDLDSAQNALNIRDDDERFIWRMALGQDGLDQYVDQGAGNRYSYGNNFSDLTVRKAASPRTASALEDAIQRPKSIGFADLTDEDKAIGAAPIPLAVNTVDAQRIASGYFGLYERTKGTGVLARIDARPTDTLDNNPIQAISYGGHEAGNAHDDVMYVARPTEVSVRIPGGSGFARRTLLIQPPFTDIIRDLVVDPNDWKIAYVVSDNFVFKTVDGGLNWNSVAAPTGVSMRTVELIPAMDGSHILAVGGLGGIYTAGLAAGSTALSQGWCSHQGNIPNVGVYDLRFRSRGDGGPGGVLIAATRGRGVWTLDLAGVSGAVRLDANGDGTIQEDEPGISSATVNLWLDVNQDGIFDKNTGDTLEATTTTGAGGGFSFVDTSQGREYFVEVIAPSGFSFSAPGLGFVQADGPDGSSHGSTVELGLKTATIGDLVFLDSNRDGLFKDVDGDEGLANRLVELYKDNGNGVASLNEDALIASTHTDESGRFLFFAQNQEPESVPSAVQTGLAAGDYFLRFHKPLLQSFTKANVGSNSQESIDSDVTGNRGQTDVFSLSTSEQRMDIDAGTARGLRGFIDRLLSIIRLEFLPKNQSATSPSTNSQLAAISTQLSGIGLLADVVEKIPGVDLSKIEEVLDQLRNVSRRVDNRLHEKPELTGPNVAPTSTSSDSKFLLRLDDEEPAEVVVPATSNVVAAVNAALVAAGFVDDNSAPIFAASLDGSGHLQISLLPDDRAKAITASTLRLTAANAAPLFGQTTAQGTVEVKVTRTRPDGLGGTFDEDETLSFTLGTTPAPSNQEPFPYTNDNANVQELADDVNLGFAQAGLFSVKTLVDNGKLVLAATDPEVTKIELLQGAGILNFGTSVSATATGSGPLGLGAGTRGLPVLKFSTVPGLVTELNNALSAISGQTFSANVVHDTQTNSILFDFNLDVDFLNQAINLDLFDGIDLGPFELELAAIADASIDVGLDLQTRMGISLDPAGSDFTLGGGTLLSEINGGDGVDVLVGMTATNPTPMQGQPGSDVNFTITVDREGTSNDSTHSLVLLKNKDNAAPLKPSTDDNTDATTLVDDLNRLFEQEGLERVVEAGLITDKDSNGQVTAQRIYLTALDPLANAMMLSGPDLSLLGFVGTTVSSNYPDMVLQVGSSLPVDVVLDGAETIQAVLDRIATASSGAITAAVGGDDNLALFSSQEFTLIPAVVPTLFEASVASTSDALTSRAGISLGILGESDGGVLEGVALHGEGIDDLIFFVEQPQGQQDIELSLSLNSDLDLGAAIGPLGLSLTTPTPVTFDVTTGIRLVDPNADDGLIHLSEIFAAPNDVFDFSGLTPTFQAAGSFELSASFLGGAEDNTTIVGDVLGTTTNPTITVDIMADNNGFDFEINENLSQISLKDMLEQLKEVSPEQIITLIGDMVQEIKENPDLPFLNKNLPVIDKSLNEIVDFADALIVGIEKVINSIDLDVLGDAVEDLAMAINNIALPEPVKDKLLRVVDVLRRISGDLDPAQLVDEFNLPTDFARRLPARLLSGAIQAGKEIQAALATIPGSVTRPVAGELDLDAALAKLAKLVPAINTIEARIEDAVSEAIANALQVPQNDVQFKIGFVSDYDSATPLTKQRALVVGLSIDVNNLSLQFDPQFPSTEFGPIELELQTMFDLYADAEIDLGLGVTLEASPKFFVIAEPPSSSSSDFDDDLVKTQLGLTAGFAGSVEGSVKFGSLDVITANGELDLLTSVNETGLTIDGLDQVTLQAAPVDSDRRFVIVAVDGNVADVESFEVSGNKITFLSSIPTSSQSIDVYYQSAATPPPAPTSGPDLRAMTEANRAGLDVTFDDTTSFVNTIGAIEFGDLGNNVELDAQGLLTGSVGAEFLGKEVSDAVTLALSLNHPLDPQLTVDTDVLTSLLEGVDFDLKTILIGIEAFLDTLEEGLTEDVLARLPVIGDGFDADETFIGRLRDDFVTPLRQFLCDVGGSLEEVRDFIEIEVFRLLGPGLAANAMGPNMPMDPIPAGLNILKDRNNDSTIDLNDVDVDLTLDNFMIAVSIGGEDKVEVDFDSGLAGLPIVADAQGGVELGWEYTIDLGFGVDRYEGFYLVTNDNAGLAEFRLDNFGAQLIVDTTSGPEPIPTSLTVDLLGLKLSATDQLTTTGAAGTVIGGSVLLDLNDPDDNMKLFVSEITDLPFKDLFNVDVDAGVSIDLLLEAGINDTLPSIQAELIVDWSANLDIINGQVAFASTGLNAGFENIGINLGDFLSRHIGSAVKQITKFIEPIEPVIRALKQEVPGLSAISQAKGNGPITFLDLALLRVPDKAEQARKFVNAIDTLLEISRGLESVDPDALVFVLQEEFALIQGGSNELEDPSYSTNVDTDQLVQNNPAQEEPTEEATGGIRALLQKIEDLGINLHFLETKNLVNFLLKRPFDVISYDLPRFELPFTFEKQFPVWSPPKIDVRVGLDANIFADLSVGYDSHGLDTGRFFDGFYFGDREDVFVGADIDEFGLGLGVRLAALLDIVVASAGVEGEIRGDVLANWRDLDDDGKLHLDELTQIVRHDGIDCLFDLRGELRAIVRLVWEVLGKEGSKELFNKVLFEFANDCPHYELGHVADGGETLPGGPTATAAQGTLILHAGAFASERRGGATSDIAEEFTVKQLARGVFQVNALELESRYSGVTQIFFDGGLGNDQLILDGVDVPVVALGGPGQDILYGTQHSDYLDGGAGNDELYARGGIDDVFGGGGNDLIYGDLAPNDTNSIWGTGAMDTIDGGAGADTIHAAEGDDLVMGGTGDDEIFGDVGVDTIHAGSGNDAVYGGDDGDFLFGDAGNDALFGQGGNDQVEGGTGSDLAMGGAGNDILRGNSGIDVLIGGIGGDDLFGQQGNDALFGGLATANSNHALVVGAILPAWLAEITSQEQDAITNGTSDLADDLWGGVDNDLLVGDDGADRQYGGWGNDVILAHQINVQSTAHDEYIEGGPGDDFICGADGVDAIFGGTADAGLQHILDEVGATPTLGSFSLLSCINGEIVVEPPPVTSSLAGVKYHDANGDGVRDENDALLEGWTILLLDGIGEVIASAVTDENGAYLFDQLSPGDYTVAEEQQTDWLQTTVDHTVALLPDQTLTNLDIGNQFDGATVTGQKWLDLNGNGMREAGELGLNGWQIVLTDDAGTEFTAVTADVDLNNDEVIDPFTERGVYRFVDLPSGNYAVSELPKAGWIQSAPQLSDSEVFAPIADDGYSQTRSDRFVDAGVATGLIQTIDVSVQVEHARLSDLSGFLLSPAGTRVDLTEFIGGPTDPLNVLIGEPAAGVWTLSITDNLEGEAGKLLDWQLTITTASSTPPPLEGGTPSILSPGRTLAYELSISAGDELTRDFGNYQPATVEGIKFVDRNGNGVRDFDDPVHPGPEPGLAGVVIFADLNNNGLLDRGEPSTITQSDDPDTLELDETGHYSLRPLPPRAANASYTIREVLTGGYTQTFPAGGGHSITPLSGETIDVLDFGNTPPASVHGEKWLDENGDGLRDDSEPGLAGVIIYADLNNNQMRDPDEPSTITMTQAPALLVGDTDGDLDVDQSDLAAWEANYGALGTSEATGDFSGNEVSEGFDFILWQRQRGSTVEHEEGAYWLDGIPAGEVTIREIVPIGYEQTFPNEQTHTLFVAPGEVITGIDFGNLPLEGPFGSIHGTKWNDQSADGTRDPDELGIAGVEIYLDLNNNGQHDPGEPLTATAADDLTTPEVNEAGGYWFTGLDEGEYAVREIVPSNTEQVYPGTGVHVVRLGENERIEGVDFGNWIFPDPTGGDGDGDGDVDGDDLDIWIDGYGQQFTNASSGNFNGDTITSGADFLTWQNGFTGPPRLADGIAPNGLAALGDFEETLDDTAANYIQQVAQFNDALAPGEVYEEVNFGNQQGQLGKVHGHKFEDLNGNGVWDPNEQPLENWVIEITGGDLNGDGMIDLNDRLTTVTNAMGEYWFMDLFPGVYTVREVQQPGWLQTTDGGIGGNGALTIIPGTIEWTIDLGPGEVYSNLDFGNQMDMPPTPLPDGDDIIYAAAGDDVQVYGDNLVSNPMIISVGTRRDTIFGQAGDDHLFGQEEDDILWGADELLGVLGPNDDDDDMLDGGDGIDEVRQTVDADQTLINTLLTGQGNDQLVSVERATLTGGSSVNLIDATAFTGPVSLFGLDGDDVLRGGSNDDQLDGGGGSDDLFGRAGDDRYLFTPVTGAAETDTIEELVGQGTDMVDFSGLNHSVTVNLLGGLPGDRIAQEPGLVRVVNVLTSGNEANFENIVGTPFNDTLTGNNAANLIFGLAGSDFLHGGAGNDRLDLGGGTNDTAQGGNDDDLFVFADGWGSATLLDGGGVDTVDLSAVTQSLLVEIGSLTVTEGTNTITHLTNDLEHVVGGQADDTFRFTSDGSSLPAGGTIDGQAGANWLDYIGYTTTSANVDLSFGTAQGVPGGISNITNVLGGAAGETITGDSNANLLDGRGGADTILGLVGDDLIVGGTGDDLLLDGGAGNDVYQISDNEGNDNIADSGPAVDIDVLDLRTATSDLHVNVQAALLTVDNVTHSHQITSTQAIEEIFTGGGHDTVFFHGTVSLPGTSKINGGEGDDALNYSNYTNPVFVNLSSEDHPAPPATPTILAGTAAGVSAVSGFVNVIGSAQNDVIVGNSHDNRLEGLAGSDELFGLQGDDVILGGIGANTMTGGGGDDLYIIDPGPNTLTVVEQTGRASSGFASNGGIDTIDFSAVGIALSINISSNPELENIIGSSTQPNVLIGNENNNLLIGGNQSDRIEGGDGNDLLVGQGAADWIVGGSGNDVLLGGSGDDGTGLDGTNPRVFVGGTGRDILVGGTGQDRIDADDDEEDIVIDGMTSYENVLLNPTHQAAWETLRDIWQSTTLTRAMRESLISSGVGSLTIGGPFKLDGTTVFSDGDTDNLSFDAASTSNGVDDWVFAEVGDVQIANLASGSSIRAQSDSERAAQSLNELLGVQRFAWSSDFLPGRRSGYIVRDRVFADFGTSRDDLAKFPGARILDVAEPRDVSRATEEASLETTLEEDILATVFDEL